MGAAAVSASHPFPIEILWADLEVVRARTPLVHTPHGYAFAGYFQSARSRRAATCPRLKT